MMPTVAVCTLGCKVAQYESEAIGEAFERAGATLVSEDTAADIYVINTCTVTAESDRKSRQTVRRAISHNPNAVVAVVGCYSQRSAREVASIEGVSIVLGTQDKLSVVPLALGMLEGERERGYISAPELLGVGFEEMKITRAPRTRAYVKIEDGCESRCSYCAIRLARGPVRSKPVSEVIAEVEGLYARGTREVVLTGIETGSYGKDLGEGASLAELILELDRRHSCDRLRLGSLAPELVGEEFIKKVAGAKILAPHFHLSVQSGSDNVLRAMRRRYNREGALRTIELLREYIPRAQFTTDLMVGFPGESEEDFLSTVDFARRARFLDAHVFAYSKREGTDAASMKGQIDSATKKERSRRLIEVCHGVRDSVLDEIVERGEPLSVILETEREGVFSSHSSEFCEVELEARGFSQGDMVRVIPVSHENGIIKGRLAD